MPRQKPVIAALAAALTLSAAPPAEARIRAVHLGPENCAPVGRNMDWRLPMVRNLWLMPHGIEHHGTAGDRSVTWTALYGSLAVSGYDISTADGMKLDLHLGMGMERVESCATSVSFEPTAPFIFQPAD